MSWRRESAAFTVVGWSDATYLHTCLTGSIIEP
jgi:hypothetical protein